MDKDFEQVRSIFLADDLDDETRADNEDQLKEWETSIRTHQNFADWEAHDITQHIIQQAKASYKEFGLDLARNRLLTEAQRQTLFAKQDAIVWLLSLTDTNAKESLNQIHFAIKTAIDATK